MSDSNRSEFTGLRVWLCECGYLNPAGWQSCSKCRGPAPQGFRALLLEAAQYGFEYGVSSMKNPPARSFQRSAPEVIERLAERFNPAPQGEMPRYLCMAGGDSTSIRFASSEEDIKRFFCEEWLGEHYGNLTDEGRIDVRNAMEDFNDVDGHWHTNGTRFRYDFEDGYLEIIDLIHASGFPAATPQGARHEEDPPCSDDPCVLDEGHEGPHTDSKGQRWGFPALPEIDELPDEIGDMLLFIREYAVNYATQCVNDCLRPSVGPTE
jgi:hypothetical protein